MEIPKAGRGILLGRLLLGKSISPTNNLEKQGVHSLFFKVICTFAG